LKAAADSVFPQAGQVFLAIMCHHVRRTIRIDCRAAIPGFVLSQMIR